MAAGKSCSSICANFHNLNQNISVFLYCLNGTISAVKYNWLSTSINTSVCLRHLHKGSIFTIQNILFRPRGNTIFLRLEQHERFLLSAARLFPASSTWSCLFNLLFFVDAYNYIVALVRPDILQLYSHFSLRWFICSVHMGLYLINLHFL